MAPTENLAILQLGGTGAVKVFDLWRFDQLCDDLPRPSQQRPRIIHFIGRSQKDGALKQLFQQNNVGRRRPHSCINLRLDLSTVNHDSPIFFMDSDPFRCVENDLPSEFSPSTPYGLSWQQGQVGEEMITDVLHARLLFLFADLVCLFVEDFPKIQDVWARIRKWVNIGSASTLERSFRPRLLLVTSADSIRDIPFEFLGGESSFFDSFSSVHIFRTGPAQLSVHARFLRLRHYIFKEVEVASSLRETHYAAFTALHIEALFRKAIEHWAEYLSKPFNFLAASRPNEGHGDLAHHFARFFRLSQQLSVPYPDIVSYFSTALLSNAYPPEMHCTASRITVFDPAWVFHEIYRQPCSDALQHFDISLNLTFCSDVASDFVSCVESLGAESSSKIRQLFLKQRWARWSCMSSNNTCLSCLERPPEHPLVCGHSLCDSCVLRYAIACMGTEDSFYLDSCILCQAEIQVTVRIKPPSAGVRILTVDGGGTRGAIPLESLCLLQELLGDFPIQDCFDLSVGTSTGGLIVLGLNALLWSPKHCSTMFDRLSREIFGHKKTEMSPTAIAKRLWRCWVNDKVHDPQAFETALQSIFGRESRLFGPLTKPQTGLKFAVVTSSISDATPFVLSNYNGEKQHDTGNPSGCSIEKVSSYEVLRPEHSRDEPRLWEAARATSAAPILYPTFRLGHLGDFQDGGLKHNNPTQLACWESRRLWPSIQSPCVLLNLGTGTCADRPPQSSKFRHFLLDGFVPRLFRSYMDKIDGERMWGDFVNSLDEKSRSSYYRLNVPLTGAALLDDASIIGELRERVRSLPAGGITRLQVARALLISCFYFQLENLPRWTKHGYHVHGSIRCRSNSWGVVNGLSRVGIDDVEFTTEVEVLRNLSAVRDDICGKCSRYRKDVHFFVRHPLDMISIYVKSGSLSRCRLGGFPQSIDWFINQQGLRGAFGSSNHNIPGQLTCPMCAPGISNGRKRAHCTTWTETPSKRSR
jgi:hypothetical protein